MILKQVLRERADIEVILEQLTFYRFLQDYQEYLAEGFITGMELSGFRKVFENQLSTLMGGKHTSFLMQNTINKAISDNLCLKNGQLVSGIWKNLFFSFIAIYKDFFGRIEVILILDKPLEFNLNFKEIIKQGCKDMETTK